MERTVPREVYNLLEEKWIPVLYVDGRADRVGIVQTLTNAGSIRLIAASNPMDRLALLRFLLAVLMWCRQDAKIGLSTLEGKGSGIPESWLVRLKEHAAAFNLLGAGMRFYQDESLQGKDSRPIGDLLVEFPGADSVNHMRHVVYDGSCGFCPACCAMGILRLSVWAPANRYYPSSVNPGSAAYAIIEGRNLLHTLRANLPEENPHTDLAPWLANEQPHSPDVVAMLAWRPRILWLNAGGTKGVCASCGRFDELITSLCNEGGWPTPTSNSQKFSKAVEIEFKNLGYRVNDKSHVDDNAKKVVKMASLIRKCRMDDLRQAYNQNDSQPQAEIPTMQTDEQEIVWLFHQLFLRKDESEKTIKVLTRKPSEEETQALGDGDMLQKKFWEADPHLLRDGEALSLPGLGADVGKHSTIFWRKALRLQRRKTGKFRAIGPVVNNFSFQDCVYELIPDASVSIKKRSELSGACNDELSDLLRKVTRNPERQHPEIGSAIKLLMPNAEARIRNLLNRIDWSPGNAAIDAEEFLRKEYLPIIEQVISSVIPGSSLRRRVGLNHAYALLNRKIKELVENQDLAPNSVPQAEVPGNPMRSHKRGGTR